MDFPRSRSASRTLPLIPMIDVVFILIVFFMLTTSFMKIESMELLLPTVSTTLPKASANFAHILLKNDGTVSFGGRQVTEDELAETLKTLFAANPEQRIVILTADQVSLQTMVSMMDLVYLSGGKSVYIKAWGSGARSQEPGVRSQEPGVRSQESGARSQEPGTRNQNHSSLIPGSWLLAPES